MAGAVETAVVSAAIKKLFDSISGKEVIDFFLNRPDKALVEELKKNFLSLKTVLNDAEEKQFVDPHVREWVDRLIDAAYEADDFLDAIATKTSKRSQIQSPFSERVKPKLLLINEKLKSLGDSRDLLGLKEGGRGKKFSLSLPTTSLVDTNEVYGRDSDRDKIKEFLLSGTANGRGVPVVAIVGMAGVGKTTLAQLLFNDDEVRERFSLRSWAYISCGLDAYETTKRIYGSVCKSVHYRNKTDLNLLQLEIQVRLARKRFLLVLDDFWNENFLDWDILKRPFESGGCGSRIIVTTRSQSVALTIRAALTHSLPLLSDQDSWKLFSSHAFESGDPDKHPALKEIGGRITKRCNGLPLAAKALGSLLRSKEDPEEWSSILNSKIWEFPNDKCDILPALRLSYGHLPSHLKRCFAYCSIFPKGETIEKWKLISLWMAEGLLPQQKTHKRLEDVGAECFDELVSRSFFKPRGSSFVTHDLSNELLSRSFFDPRRSSFEMHDLFNELAQYVAGEFCSKLDDIKPTKTTVKLRHVSYKAEWYDGPDRFLNLKDYRGSLRTFLPLKSDSDNQNIGDNFVKELEIFIHLRVLSLSHYGIKKVPDSIKELKHLRYLDLSSTKIEHLSDSVVELQNLETLLLSNCRDLTELPKNMFKLTNLRRLDIRGSSKVAAMPEKFGKLQGLQVLTHFVASIGGAGMSELGDISHLHSLTVVKLENVVNAQDASQARLGRKEYLRELELEWRTQSSTVTVDPQRENEVLDMLQPHGNLMRLQITKFRGNTLPRWLGTSLLSSLVFLRLDGCESCLSLRSLGQLPSLKVLHILKMQKLQRVGPEFCGNGRVPFGSLKILKFEDMPNWVEWSPNDYNQGQAVVTLASLQKLYLSNCPKLTGDLNQFPAEVKLSISRSPALEDLLRQRI